MGKKLSSLFISLVSAIIIIAPINVHAANVVAPGVTYSSHVQNIGWQDSASNGGESGTDGRGLRLEGIKINLTGELPSGAGITYQTQVQNVGWQGLVSNGTEAGTDGKGLREEAIKITLLNMPGYSVQYRVHVQNIGWQGWVSDGTLSGTVGKSLRLEALEVKIVSNIIHPISVSLNKTTDSLTLGATDTLVATVTPINAANKVITWTSSNASIATVDNIEKVTAVNTGIAKITATTADGNKIGTCAVTVNKDNPVGKVTSVNLNKNTDTLTVGSIDTLNATITPLNATNKAVTWTSSDTSIATVDNEGKVIAVNTGTATITVISEDGSNTDNCFIIVQPVNSNLELNKPYKAEDGMTITVTNIQENEEVGSIKYIVSYTLKNETTDKKIDEATFKMYFEDGTNLPQYGFFGYLFPAQSLSRIYTFEVLKTQKPTSIEYGADFFATKPSLDTLKWNISKNNQLINPTSINLNKIIENLTIGNTDTLVATIMPDNTTNKAVTWASSNAAIATIDNAGKITAVKAGTATITVTTVDGSKTATCTVTVNNPIIKVTSVSLNKTTDSLVVGSADTLTSTVNPINATNKAVTWTSSDASIATVDNVGKVTTVSVGTATITATSLDGSKIDTCTVTVAADPIIADYTYTVTDGKAKIVKYTGAGGIVIIPSTLAGFPVTSIGDSAFYGCSSLITTNIPAGITSIGYNAFGSCWSLTSITVAVDNPNYSSINGVLYNKAGTTLIAWSGGLTTISIPQSVTSIGDYAFYGNRVTTISIPQGLTSIGNGAFYGSGLTTINIPEGVTSIGNQAFSACTSLTNISVNPANLYYTSIDGMLFNKTGTILIACPGSLTTVNIPQGVTSIGDEAFRYCTGITTINIPQEVTSIGDSAFSCCSSLTNITVNAANLNFMSINGVLFNKTGTILIACPDGLTTLNIPEGVTSIGNYAFEGSGLTNISISQGVTSIGNWTFYGCNGLTTINIPQGVTSIGFQAFNYCTGLTNITFNSATTSIYDSADTIPDTTKIIGYDSSTAKDYATKYNKTFEVNSINK